MPAADPPLKRCYLRALLTDLFLIDEILKRKG